jgi:hypothetical protein
MGQRSRFGALLAVASVLGACSGTEDAGGASAGPATGDGSAPSVSEPETTSGAPELHTKVLHTELIDGVRIEFLATPFGTMTSATGSLDSFDPDKVRAIRERVERGSLSEVFRSLREYIGQPSEIPSAIQQADSEIARQRAEGVSTHDLGTAKLKPPEGLENIAARLAESTAQVEAGPMQALALASPLKDTRAIAASDGSDAWVSQYFGCSSSQLCQVGMEWAKGGRRGRIDYQTTYFINQSYDAPADLGIRFVSWSYPLAAWQYKIPVHETNQPARTWRSYSINNIVGQYRREAFIGNRRAENLGAAEMSFGALLGPTPRVSLVQYWTEFEFKGYQSTTLTGTESRCVNNMVDAFNRVPTQPTANIRYKSRGGESLPPFNATLAEFGGNDSHVEGFGRLTVDDRRWFVVSRARPDHPEGGGGGVFLVNLDSMGTGDGRRLVSLSAEIDSFSGTPPSFRDTRFYYPMQYTYHPSGLQTMGRFAAVAADGLDGTSYGYVDIFDFATPGSTNAFVHRVIIKASTAEYNNLEVNPGREVSGAAIARLKSGKYLLFALDKSENKRGWFYVSTSASLDTATQFNTLDFTSLSAQFENVALFTECGTGDLYMLGTENLDIGFTSDGINDAWLMKLAYDPNTEQVSVVQSFKRQFGPNTDAFCTFRAAASGYVDPDGKLLLYCHTRKANSDAGGSPDSKLKLVEFGPP